MDCLPIRLDRNTHLKGMSMRFPKATSCREQTKHTWYSFKCHGQCWKKGCQRPDENLPYLQQCKELGASSFLTRQGHPLFGAAQSGSRLLAVNPIAKKNYTKNISLTD